MMAIAVVHAPAAARWPSSFRITPPTLPMSIAAVPRLLHRHDAHRSGCADGHQQGRLVTAGLGGNARDRKLVQIAKDHGGDLISFEENPKGTIQKTAVKLGVRVWTPAAYIADQGATVRVLALELLAEIRGQMVSFMVERGMLTGLGAENCVAYVQLMEAVLDDRIELTMD